MKKRPLRIPLIVIGLLLLFVLCGLIIFHWVTGILWADWTGFSAYTGPLTKDQRGKTLWDWMGLFIIPIGLGFAAYWFYQAVKARELIITEQRRRDELDLAKKRLKNDHDTVVDQQREQALQNYINKITDLLLEKNLRRSQYEDEVQDVARILTLTILRSLDASRKGLLLRFLREAQLIMRENQVFDMSGADLRETDLRKAYMSKANFRRVDLSKSCLDGSILNGADLSGANLSAASLIGASLSEADLTCANLSGAKLGKAILSGAKLGLTILNGADLGEADLDGADLDGAYLCKASLFKAYLSGTNLNKVDLSEANLSGANLSKANLSEANLTKANLSGADLTKANLSRAYLNGTDLSRANLSWTNLSMANLNWANLTEANLSGADLSGVTISEQRLKTVKSLENATMPNGKKYDPAFYHF